MSYYYPDDEGLQGLAYEQELENRRFIEELEQRSFKMTFKKAERKKAKLRLALCGPSGSGKTYSALQIAIGLGGKIAMIDTEHHSGELYSHLTDYDVAPLVAPYSPERYVELILQAEKAGYDVLIIDSLSHAWAGEGGVLDMVDKAAKATRSQNSYTAWRYVTPEHNRLVDALLKSKMHIITTIRTKTDYETSTDEKGKMKVQKVGLAPVQREGLDYEFTTVLDLSIDGHIATASKDRTGIFDNKFVLPSPETGGMLLDWLNSGTGEEEIVSRILSLGFDKLNAAENFEDLKKSYAEVWTELKGNKAAQDELRSTYEQRKKAFIEQPAV